MKYLLAQPAIPRFQWELEVVLTNILNLDPKAEIVCLFISVAGKNSEGVFDHIARKYPTVKLHMYEDNRVQKQSIPTIRPFLWYCYLSEDPSREKETYFQIDSDVIFRELPNFASIPVTDTTWYGSNCSSYIDYNYLKGCEKGEYIVDNFANIIGIPRQTLEKCEGAGAQWLIKNPTAEYWLKVLNDCSNLWNFLEPQQSNIQKWTAEMWAQLLNAPYFGIEYKIHKELDFCMPTDTVERWSEVKILHNSGVVGPVAKELFYKGQFIDESPLGRDFSYVNPKKAGIYYVNAIKNVII